MFQLNYNNGKKKHETLTFIDFKIMWNFGQTLLEKGKATEVWFLNAVGDKVTMELNLKSKFSI